LGKTDLKMAASKALHSPSIKATLHGFGATQMFRMRQLRVAVDAGDADWFLSLCFVKGKA
jgi:hypothetical protein